MMRPIICEAKTYGYWPIEVVDKGKVLQILPHFLLDLLHDMSFVQAIDWVRLHVGEDCDRSLRLPPEKITIIGNIEVTRKELLLAIHQKKHKIIDIMQFYS